ncbi:hypothetical protein FH972_021923 [Carpinus fangiana]|uniref:protein-tyrosine-phosphatase n=1 Tax=Carpinus fangiana TaxID=176857 RepID=A0A5N6KRD7_9ROSI|nr:hypothetical protein FH972_021923 [Carpinus fangiana]
MPAMAPFLSPRTPHPKTPAREYKTSSPNYFGLVVEQAQSTFHQHHQAPKNNWSPPSSNIRSAAADSPQAIPHEANPDFEAFRRQSEQSRFRLSQSSISLPGLDGEAPNKTDGRPLPKRNESHPGVRTQSIPNPHNKAHQPETAALLEPESLESRSPKRLLSHDSSTAFDRPRRESPAAFQDGFESSSSRSNISSIPSSGSPPQRRDKDLHKRTSEIVGGLGAPDLGHSRAETLPAKFLPGEGVQMVPSQHIVNLLDSAGEEMLVLDLRVSTQYARSRVAGALSLCVPTTLLKRPSHNVHKLAETFKEESQRLKFERWYTCRSIVVYDQSSSQLKEALTCQNVLKKFISEGWSGSSYIVRGGFDEFARSFPNYVDKNRIAHAGQSSTGLSLRPSTPSVAPVIGGCPMPASKNAANPFFGNIRQNMDLIGGVGQLPVKKPHSMDRLAQDELPTWLAQAADETNKGKLVADKFFQIEKREQKRMQEALSGHVSFGTPGCEGPKSENRIQVAGIEKGAKNRYNNIWPFEHSRVKLDGVPRGGCDYVNASYVQTSMSQKRFIATQAPVPGTFNDFWSMVWQSDTRVIVMLTGEKEGGQIKAHNYWGEGRYGPMRLSFLTERKASLELSRISNRRNRPSSGRQRSSTTNDMTERHVRDPQDTASPTAEQPYVIVRKFTLSHEEHPWERMREITQLQYSSWPDFGVPTHPAHLLGLVEQCDQVVRSSGGSSTEAPNGQQRPVVVHCSAGCGRTGTFCAVDTVVDIMKAKSTGTSVVKQDGNGNPFFTGMADFPGTCYNEWSQRDEIDLIEKTVEEFRLQRLSMDHWSARCVPAQGRVEDEACWPAQEQAALGPCPAYHISRGVVEEGMMIGWMGAVTARHVADPGLPAHRAWASASDGAGDGRTLRQEPLPFNHPPLSERPHEQPQELPVRPSSVARSQSQLSQVAKTAILNTTPTRHSVDGPSDSLAPPPHAHHGPGRHQSTASAQGSALTDTPDTTAPSSPQMRQNSGSDKPRVRPTTLDIPGLTKSKVSPDGRISQRDVGAKLVIVMVGLPARGKSYITKKMARYLNWLQHDTRIFNVGERRRVAAGGRAITPKTTAQQSITDAMKSRGSSTTGIPNGIIDQSTHIHPERAAAQILINGETALDTDSTSYSPQTPQPLDNMPNLRLSDTRPINAVSEASSKVMDQSADFFDPSNRKAALIREQVALETLDELLDYILEEGGAVGILDATNSTLERRKLIMKHVRERAGEDLNVLFMESLCVDEGLLESNMRLKLSGPDYVGKDPEASLADFKKRVAIYAKAYVPLGDYEEKNNMPYVQMIDVGRKVISHQVKGFLSAQAVYYLLNFNLAPRQIWITRHGESVDNKEGRIGGDSDLTGMGCEYARALAKFIEHERAAWDIRQAEKEKNVHMPPLPGDHTPPNPHYEQCIATDDEGNVQSKNFCVWTSMLKRSIQTAECFDEEEFEIKQMRMLDELFSGTMEGMTYDEIRKKFPDEYEHRRRDKLQYRYPGPGGEGYLDVINRLRPVIVELERMTDHCLLIGHRSVARVLLAYFKGLGREDVTDLDVPLGMLYCLEPKPYGVDFRAYRYSRDTQWFHHEPNYELRQKNWYLMHCIFTDRDIGSVWLPCKALVHRCQASVTEYDLNTMRINKNVLPIQQYHFISHNDCFNAYQACQKCATTETAARRTAGQDYALTYNITLAAQQCYFDAFSDRSLLYGFYTCMDAAATCSIPKLANLPFCTLEFCNCRNCAAQEADCRRRAATNWTQLKAVQSSFLSLRLHRAYEPATQNHEVELRSGALSIARCKWLRSPLAGTWERIARSRIFVVCRKAVALTGRIVVAKSGLSSISLRGCAPVHGRHLSTLNASHN